MISLSVSEVKVFLECRRKWHYYSQRGKDIQLVRPSEYLFVGSAGHHALDTYYAAGMKQGTAIKAFDDYVNKNWASVAHRSFGETKFLQDAIEVGRGTIEHYEKYSRLADTDFEVVATETPVVVEDGLSRFVGVIDMVIRKDDGYWIVDHKFLSRFPRYDELFFSLQAAAYLWGTARDKNYKNFMPIQGFIYNLILKRVPKYPKILKNGSLSQAQRSGCSPITYREALVRNEESEEDYKDFLETLDIEDFFKREPIPAYPQLAINWSNTLYKVIDEIQRGVPDLEADSRTCAWCAYKSLCNMRRIGGDWHKLEKYEYMPREHLDFDNEE